MLSIYVYGNNDQEGFIDLEPGASLDMEELTPSFDENLSIGAFSLPFDIPWTENNRRIFGFNERITGYMGENNYWTCDAFDDGFPEIQKGKLTFVSKAGKLNYGKGKFSASISGSRPIYGAAIKNKTLKDLSLGGPITWEDADSRQFAQLHSDGSYPGYNHFTFVPVAIEGFIDPDRADYSGEFLARDVVNCIVNTVSGPVFGRPTTDDVAIPAAENTLEYVDYRTVPFFKLQYILKKCFQEFGYQVSGDFVNDSVFNDLLLFNNYGIEKYNATLFVDNNRSITPSNHVPKTLISDFLKSVLGFFNVYPFFTGGTEVKLMYRKKNLTEKKVVNLDKVLVSDFESNYQDGETPSGYLLNYNWDSADSFFSDRVKDITTKTLVATVSTFADLGTLSIGRPFTTDDIVYVEAENIYYNAASPDPTWDAWAERLNEYRAGDGEQEILFDISTLCTYVIFVESTGLLTRQNFCGCRQRGSYLNNKGTLVQHEYGIRVFYGKKLEIDSYDVPSSFNHNRNPDNTQRASYSLAWNGTEAMAENFHTRWQDALRNKEILKIKIDAANNVIKLIREANTIEIQSVHFLHYKTERTIPASDQTTIYLVAL
jgi:hypothetical protein